MREAAHRAPSPRLHASSNIVDAFFDDALWSVIIGFLSPTEVIIFGRVCKAGHAMTVASWASWWFQQQMEYVLPMRLTAAMAPDQGHEWTWERLHLCVDPFLDDDNEPIIEFWVASDQINMETCRSAAMVARLDAIAAKLRKHPRLVIRVEGHAARDAPTIYGGPISQARATRVRSELVKRLRDHPAWSVDGEPSLGRAPSHLDDRDIEDVYQFYHHQELVGKKLQALGVWRRDDSYFATHPSCGGQSAEVRIVGYEMGGGSPSDPG